MKNSGKKNQIKQTNKKQPTSKGHTTYGEGSYFNPYATHMPVQSRTRSTYKTNTTMQKVDDNRKKDVRSKTSSKSTSANRNKITPKRQDSSYVRGGDRGYQQSYTNPYSATSYTNQNTTPYIKEQYVTPNRQVTQENNSPHMRREQIKKNNKLTRAQIYRNKKRKQRQLILRIALVMIFTTFGVWGAIEIKEALTKTKISYQVVKTGTIDNSRSLSGIILRNEQVVYSQDEGNVQYVVSEGEKVKKDGLVYVLVDEEQLAQSTKTENEVDEQIYQKAEERKDISFYQDQIYDLSEEVKADIEAFYDNRYENTTHFIYTLRNQLDQNVNKRTSIYTQEQQDQEQSIAALKTELQANINQYRLGKTAPQAGIISYKLDGQETSNLSEVIETLNYDKYNSIIKNSNVSYLNKSEVTKEEPVYKIILDNKWYIISYVDLSQDEAFKEGQNYNLDFTGTNSKQVTFKLVSKKAEDDKRIQLVFETSDQISNFLDLRYVDFSIGNKNVTGLKIPLQAIVEQNMLKIPATYCIENEGQLGVYRKVGEVTEFVPIKIQYQKEDNNYIRQDITNSNNVQVNNVLVDPQSGSSYEVTEIETKQGVYVINGKIAQFKTIEIELVSGEYAIVKYDGNTQLKEMDKMISNPKSIKIDQLLEDMNVQNE